MSDDTLEWFPAAVMRPVTGRSLELLLRGDPQPHRGSYRLHRYVLAINQDDVAESDVLSWRYVEAEPTRR